MLTDEQWAEHLANQQAESDRRSADGDYAREIKQHDRHGPRAAGMGARYCDGVGGCGKLISPVCPQPPEQWDEPPAGYGVAFRNLLCLREWQLTGVCQECQDRSDRFALSPDDLPVWAGV